MCLGRNLGGISRATVLLFCSCGRKRRRVYVAVKGGRFATVASAVRRNCGLNCFSKPSRRAGLPLFDLFLRRLGLGMSALASVLSFEPRAAHLPYSRDRLNVRAGKVSPSAARLIADPADQPENRDAASVWGDRTNFFFSAASPPSHSAVFSQLFCDPLSTAVVSNASLPLSAPHLAFKCRGYILVAGPSNCAPRLFRPTRGAPGEACSRTNRRQSCAVGSRVFALTHGSVVLGRRSHGVQTRGRPYVDHEVLRKVRRGRAYLRVVAIGFVISRLARFE